MTFRSPERRGRILAGDDPNTFRLSDGTSATYSADQNVTGESAMYIKISPQVMHSLSCLEDRWPLTPFSPEWVRARKRLED